MRTLICFRGKFNYFLKDEKKFQFEEALSEPDLKKEILEQEGELAFSNLERDIRAAEKKESDRNYREYLDWLLYKNKAGDNDSALDLDVCIEAFLS
jgi:hypothetical protein